VSMNPRRVRAIFRKELREYRRHTSIVVSVAIFPLIFLIQPLAVVFVAPGSSARPLAQDHLLLYMLAIPVLAPAMLAAYAVAGERQQGTLEPVLTTPIHRVEFLIGKALAVLVPSVVIAYAMYAVFLALVQLFADSAVASALLRPSDIVIQVVLTPLLATWSTWVGLAISTRSSDVRVAQQLSLLGNLPLVLVTSLVAFDVVHVTLGLALGLGAVLLVVDVMGWRIVAAMFDRERLITGTS
jgi:ABC-type transport system involved in multi-copper enzyme maturation permease subunit